VTGNPLDYDVRMISTADTQRRAPYRAAALIVLVLAFGALIGRGASSSASWR
jgi:hypothetical protein